MSTKTEAIEQRAEALLQPIVDAQHFELVDVEYVKEAGTWYLRAYIDKEGGITVDDCELVSRAWEAELDRADHIEDAYILEVSSPGLGRPLKKEKDFLRARGSAVEVRFYQTVDGEKEITGILQDATAEDVTIRVDEEEKTFSRKSIAQIRMAIEW